MSNYRRALVPGGCFFFTVNLLERRQTPLVDQIAGLREAVATTRQGHPFSIDAFVVLPDHLHAVWTLPQGDSDLLRKDGIAIQETDMVEDGRRFRGKDALHR
jgi:putative transposase